MTTLGMLLWDKVSIDVDLVLKIFIGVCELLRETHSQGYAVGTLHPEGIVIVRAGDELTSVHIKKSGALCQVAFTDEISLPFEKTCYLSPEQLDGLSPSPRSDIYAIGSMMYTALVGAPPVDSKNSLRLLIRKKNTDPAYQQKIADLETVIKRCLMDDEKKRYKSVEELHWELTNVLRGSAPSLIEPEKRRVVTFHHAKTILASLAASVLLVIGLASFNSMQGNPEQLTEPAIESVWNKKANQYEHGDPFAMVLRANRECYAFVFYVNADDSAISLHPSKALDNKKLEESQYIILDTVNNNTMHVDDTKGVFLLVSIAPDGYPALRSILNEDDFSNAAPKDHCLKISGSELYRRLDQAKLHYPGLVDYRVENAPRAKMQSEESERTQPLRFGKPDRIEITLQQ
jgi:serine/threonine protein kinase